MSTDNTPTLTIADILQRLDQIHADTAHLDKAIAALQSITQSTDPGQMNSPGDIAGQEKAKALGDVVKCRETTNQQLIALYKQMYDDIKSPINDYKTGQLRQILETFTEADEYMLPSMEKVAMQMLGLKPQDN